ncbi:hypothetical protein Pelo_15483 [Pelomyxa schiedti]|nr:hypothetical protein Pelo_15483 [Pelomyxa schiedti]
MKRRNEAQAMLGVMLQSRMQNQASTASSVVVLPSDSTPLDPRATEERDCGTATTCATTSTDRGSRVILNPPWPNFGALRMSIKSVFDIHVSPPFWPHADQLGGPDRLAQSIGTRVFGIGNYGTVASATGTSSRADERRLVYEGTLRKLAEHNVNVKELRTILVISAGGTPYSKYCFGGCEGAIEAQVQLAMRFGLIFDVLPLLFCDFDSSLHHASIGMAAAVLGRLLGEQQPSVDGIMFACKGTCPAALAVFQFLRQLPAKRTLPLIAMGTDMQYFYNNCSPLQISPTELGPVAPMLIFNSKQDTSVHGISRTSLNTFMSEISRANPKSREVLFDIDTHMPEWFPHLTANPDHNWYDTAFVNAHAFENLTCKEILPAIVELLH